MASTLRKGLQPPARVMLFGSFAPSLVVFRGPLITAMAAAGHEVFAVSPGIDNDIADKLRALGATPVNIRLGRASLNPFRALATSRDLRRFMRSLRPDVVIAYTITPVVLGATAARSAGVTRFVALITGLGYAFTGGTEPKRRISRLLALLMYRRALRLASVAIFQNPDDREEFRRLKLLPPSLPVALVNGSGVDLDHYPLAPLPAEPSFLMIARFLKDKGVREFGAAAARLKREHPQIRIALAGWLDESPDAIDPADVERFAASGVEMLGRLDDVRPAIADAAVYVLPSYREGTPRSVLEAMSMGRPIITTDAPGCRETVVEGDNGFLVRPRDSESLYAAMLRFVEQPELISRLGRRSREIAEQKYDVRKVNESLMSYAGL